VVAGSNPAGRATHFRTLLPRRWPRSPRSLPLAGPKPACPERKTRPPPVLKPTRPNRETCSGFRSPAHTTGLHAHCQQNRAAAVHALPRPRTPPPNSRSAWSAPACWRCHRATPGPGDNRPTPASHKRPEGLPAQGHCPVEGRVPPRPDGNASLEGPVPTRAKGRCGRRPSSGRGGTRPSSFVYGGPGSTRAHLPQQRQAAAVHALPRQRTAPGARCVSESRQLACSVEDRRATEHSRPNSQGRARAERTGPAGVSSPSGWLVRGSVTSRRVSDCSHGLPDLGVCLDPV